MKRISTSVYVSSICVALVASLLLALSVYVGGYFLLSDSDGLYPSKTVFDIYEPALRLQCWVTDKGVVTGYKDSQGRYFQLQYTAPPSLDEALPPPIHAKGSGVNSGGDGPASTPVAAIDPPMP